eukprot:TRINITY_DN12980_c0_g1_i1.p1 TRINITY_DN12980_c0_g1~~TRINITY_DN12980_c0_g1_i1.p1  ORF type:complete len:157 (+),score=17.68 TRINITY_DN12980_c0_g1_i1:52-522(+)
MLHESRTTRYLCTYEAEQRDIQHFEEYVRNHYQKLVLESKKRQGVLYLLIFWFVYSAWMNYSSADPETLSYSITIPSINTNVDDSINKELVSSNRLSYIRMSMFASAVLLSAFFLADQFQRHICGPSRYRSQLNRSLQSLNLLYCFRSWKLVELHE